MSLPTDPKELRGGIDSSNRHYAPLVLDETSGKKKPLRIYTLDLVAQHQPLLFFYSTFILYIAMS